MRNWKSQLKLAGYNPACVVDAPKDIYANIARQDIKGSVNGDESRCTGARCIQRSFNAEFALVGASIAIVVLSPKVIHRYRHNGYVPNMQDTGRLSSLENFELKLNAPDLTHRLGFRKTRHEQTKTKPRKKAELSFAAKLRA